MLTNEKKETLKMKGSRMLEQYILINYFVTVEHMVGYLEAQTNLEKKEELEAIRPELVDISARVFAMRAQLTTKNKKKSNCRNKL